MITSHCHWYKYYVAISQLPSRDFNNPKKEILAPPVICWVDDLLVQLRGDLDLVDYELLEHIRHVSLVCLMFRF